MSEYNLKSIRKKLSENGVSYTTCMETSIQQSIAEDITQRYKVDFGKGKNPVERAVLYTPEQIRNIVGEELSVKINFVPQMLTALAMELATEFINHCRDYRVHEAKKHNRVMRKAVEMYTERLYEYYGKAATAAYIEYVKRFMDVIRTDVWLLRLKLSELTANQMPEIEDREVPILTCTICGVISYIEWYDGEMDKVLEQKLGYSVKCKSNKHLDVIKALCAAIALEMKCRIEVDGQVAEWLNVLGNRAILLAQKIFAEEKAEKVDTN